MRKSKFIKHIDRLTEDELKEELIGLYDKVKEVKQYYKMELGSVEERKKNYTAAKADIASKYKTKSYRRPRRPRIQKIRKILSELEKLSIFSYELIDVYLYDVECALKFAREYDYFTQVLYNNITRSFSRAMDLIEQNRMQKEYQERCDHILQLSRYIHELYQEMISLSDDVFKSSDDKNSI